ncbi:MAG: GGDEF domain-containing protein [Opitutales bacterium]
MTKAPAMARKILLIDDDRLQFRLTQQHFKTFHVAEYELEWSATYEEGLANLLKGGYAACLLDYRLGARDGLELIREAMKRGCRVPIIFLTAETGAAVDIEAMNAGALDYLVKGEINPHMLERSLRYALKLGETLEALRQLATHDQLTGVLNRREFDRILREEVERSHRLGHHCALILIDIDHFKQVNDTHGHLAGDEVLRELSQRLNAKVRTVDRVTRFGGEEFAIVTVEADLAMAVTMAERLRASVAGFPFKVNDTLRLPVTISVGVTVCPADASDPAGLLNAADKALYAAKAAGRNRVVAYQDLPRT